MAAAPTDVSISGMTEHNGVRIIETGDSYGSDYQTVVRELGIALANPTGGPAHTLGLSGFEVTLGAGFAFNSVRSPDPNEITPWMRADASENPNTFLLSPSIGIRKGLPLGMEVGVNGQWFQGSQTGAFGGFFRAAMVEGWKPWPDLSIQIGYAGYVGNAELDVGVLDVGGTIGTTVRFGSPGITTGTFSPWASVTWLNIQSSVHVDDETAAAVGAFDMRGKGIEADTLPAANRARFSGGFQITSGSFLIRLEGSYTLKGIATARSSVGFSW